MHQVSRVLLRVETSKAYGRGALAGIWLGSVVLRLAVFDRKME